MRWHDRGSIAHLLSRVKEDFVFGREASLALASCTFPLHLPLPLSLTRSRPLSLPLTAPGISEGRQRGQF